MNFTELFINKSIGRKNNIFVYVYPIIDDNQKHIITVVNYFILGSIVSLVGTITNVINIVIFYRQGLYTTTNISFFFIAVSDLCCLIVHQVYNFVVNPLCQKLHLQVLVKEVEYVTCALPREMFARITCFFTVYITAERCLCVTFPLQIKLIIAPRTTWTTMFCICGFIVACFIPTFVTNQLVWQYYPEYNQTLLGTDMRNKNEQMFSILHLIHSFVGILSFLTILVFTAILTTKLKQKHKWRKKVSFQQDKSASLSGRDRVAMVTVVLVASISVICYAPSTLLTATMVFVPEFTLGGSYNNVLEVMWSFAFLLENINASVNMFLYLQMSSKYRREFQNLFCSRHKTP